MSELDILLDTIQDGFRGVHTRLDAINGRLRSTEQDIAVLNDRSNRDNTARVGAGASALVAGLGALWHWLKN